MKSRLFTIAVLLAIVGLVFWIAYVEFVLADSTKFLVGQASLSTTGLKAILVVYGYLTLVVGVFLGSGYRNLKERRAAGGKILKINKFLGEVFQSVDFWLGLFGSPVVYAILLQAIDLTNVSFGSAAGLTLVGLQNGFVCQSIADAIRPKGSSVPGSSIAPGSSATSADGAPSV
jgi:hypothetical protein